MNPSSFARVDPRIRCACKDWFGSDSVTFSQLYLSGCSYGSIRRIFPIAPKEATKAAVLRSQKEEQEVKRSLPFRPPFVDPFSRRDSAALLLR